MSEADALAYLQEQQAPISIVGHFAGYTLQYPQWTQSRESGPLRGPVSRLTRARSACPRRPGEIDEAMWLDPAEFAQYEWRFADQGEWLARWMDAWQSGQARP